MSLVNDLKKQRGLYALCPSCAKAFPLSKASLFDATKPLPPEALEFLDREKQNLHVLKDEFRSRRKRAERRPEIGAAASNLGKVVEKIAPSLPGFPVQAGVTASTKGNRKFGNKLNFGASAKLGGD
jgi:hypothetical protein